MALMSPVEVSMMMALPHSPLQVSSISPSSCSSKSCMVMSMVVRMVVPLRGGFSVQYDVPRVNITFLATPLSP